MGYGSFKTKFFRIHIFEGIQFVWPGDDHLVPLVFVEDFDVVFRHHLEEAFFPRQPLGVCIVLFFFAQDGEVNPQGGENAGGCLGCIDTARVIGRV